MSLAFYRYIALIFLLIVVHNLVIELTGRTGDVIATLVMIGVAVAGYLGYLYSTRDKAKYPSTVRSRLRAGLERGASGGRG